MSCCCCHEWLLCAVRPVSCVLCPVSCVLAVRLTRAQEHVAHLDVADVDAAVDSLDAQRLGSDGGRHGGQNDHPVPGARGGVGEGALSAEVDGHDGAGLSGAPQPRAERRAGEDEVVGDEVGHPQGGGGREGEGEEGEEEEDGTEAGGWYRRGHAEAYDSAH